MTGAALEVVDGTGTRNGNRPNGAELTPRVEEILDACAVAGIRTTAGAVPEHRSSADLLVVDMPARHWRRGGLTPRNPSPGASLAGVPVVLIPRDFA